MPELLPPELMADVVDVLEVAWEFMCNSSPSLRRSIVGVRYIFNYYFSIAFIKKSN